MDTKEALREYGLSEKEIKIYLALLPLGSINLQEITKRVDLPRTTIYNTLNYLVSKGLVSFIIKKNVRFYEASEPEKLIEKINEKKELLDSILPNLKSLKKENIKSSSVEIFQGTKGLSSVLSDIFKIKEQKYYFGSYSLSEEILKHLPDHFRSIRLNKKIPAKIILEKCDKEDFHKKEFKKLTELRFNDSLKDFPCMIFIYEKKVALYTLKKDLIGIIISNEQVSEAMKLIFDIYWNSSKKSITNPS